MKIRKDFTGQVNFHYKFDTPSVKIWCGILAVRESVTEWGYSSGEETVSMSKVLFL